MKLFHLLVTVLTLSVVLLAACAPPEAALPPRGRGTGGGHGGPGE